MVLTSLRSKIRLKLGQMQLTPDQEAYVRQFAQERIASMLSTTAIDEHEAEAHLSKAYEVAGLPPPQRFVWFDSPLGFVLAHFVPSVWDSVSASVRGYLDANWLAFYRFFHETFAENQLIHLALFNESVCGYRPGKQEAWLVRKPIRLERDERGRLHSADGMCIQYRDGWGFYAWHGVRVPEKIILHPEQLTKADWMDALNLEVRRAIQERMGERFVECIGGQLIDRGKRGELYAVDIAPDPERVAKYVRVKDSSTDRIYWLRVPPHMILADVAVAWTFPVKRYAPLIET